MRAANIAEKEALEDAHRQTLSSAKASHSEEVNSLVEQLHGIQSEVKQIMSNNITQIEELKSQQSAAMSELKRTHTNEKELQEDEHKKQIEAINNGITEKLEVALSEQKASYDHQIAALEEKLSDKETALSGLQHSLSDTHRNDMSKQADAHNQLVAELKAAHANETAQLSSELKQQKEAHNAEVDSLNARLEQNLANHSAQIAKLRQDSEAELESLTAKHKEGLLESSRDSSERQSDFSSTISKLRLDHQKEIDSLMQNNNAQRQQLQQQHEQRLSEQGALLASKHTNEVEILTNQLEAVQQTLRSDSVKHTDAMNEAAAATRKALGDLKDAHQQEIDTATEAQNTLRQQHAAQIETLTKSHSEAISKQQHQHEELLSQLAAKSSAEVDILKEQLQSAQQLLKEETTNHNNAMGSANATNLKTVSNLNASHQQELDTLNTDIRELHKKYAAEIQRVEDSHFEEVTQLRGDINKRKGTEQDMITETRALQREIQIQKKTLADNETELADLRDANNALHEDNLSKTDEIDSLRSQTTSLLDELQNLQSDVTAQLQQLDTNLNNTKQSHAAELSNQAVKHEELTDTINLLQQQEESLNQKISGLTKYEAAVGVLFGTICPLMGVDGNNDIQQVVDEICGTAEKTLSDAESNARITASMQQQLSLSGEVEICEAVETLLQTQQQYLNLVDGLRSAFGSDFPPSEELVSATTEIVSRHKQLSLEAATAASLSTDLARLREESEESITRINELEQQLSISNETASKLEGSSERAAALENEVRDLGNQLTAAKQQLDDEAGTFGEQAAELAKLQQQFSETDAAKTDPTAIDGRRRSVGPPNEIG
eukprot:TRINITY_DN5702_c0_g1_i1.p1 TRINITY_DN5702_c0_g1~~TRINITY_DN5702_c0_g1_i1.p1  ORF type:complete len:950 (+),score=312.71 TRINITY_DN5702_c0_g1_i1:337-2850(+)